MALSHAVELALKSTGKVVNNWDEYAITRSLLSPGSPWTFTFWRSDESDTAWAAVRDSYRLGDQLLFTIDGALQLNGVIESLKRHTSRAGTTVTVSGRDVAGIAIKAGADPAVSLRNTTLETAAQRLLAGLGFDALVIGVDADAAREMCQGLRGRGRLPTRRRRGQLDRVRVRPGEKVWDVLTELCRRQGLLPWVAPDDGGGFAVVIGAPLTEGSPTYQFKNARGSDGQVTDDSNVLESEDDASTEAVPMGVHVAARAPRGDGTPARYLINAGNEVALDPLVYPGFPRDDVYLVSRTARTATAAGKEAERFFAEHNVNFRRYHATVQGHGQTVDGRMTLYAFDTVAHVRDDDNGVDMDMLVTDVAFHGARHGGQTTRVTLAPLGLIRLIPEES